MVETLRVLIADDHEVVRSGLVALLEIAPGIRVAGEARNGAEALELARSLDPDVLIMDVSMPGADGLTAARRVRAECPRVRVLVLTGFEDREHLERLMAAGAAGYLLKRAAADELVRAIRIVGQGGTYVDPQLAGTVLRRTVGQAAPVESSPHVLSEREEEVLRSIAWGESNKQIADRLGLSTKTVETYRARIAEKLGLRTRPEIVRYAVRQGWLSAE